MANEHKGGLGRKLNNLLNDNGLKKDEKETKSIERLVFREEDYIDDINNKKEGEVVVQSPYEKQMDINPASHLIKDNVSHETNIIHKEEKSNKTEFKPSKTTKSISDDDIKLGFSELNINFIEPNPNQPRTNFDKESLEELANSIKEKGVLQPILVRYLSANKYQIIAGERRWQASKKAGLKTIPAVVTQKSDEETLELALIENIQREDLNPIEEAWGYKRLMDKLNLTQAQLAVTLSKGRSTIANSIRLLDLPETAQKALFDNKLTAGHARAILSIPNEGGRNKLTEKIINEHISVRDAEALSRILSFDPTTSVKKKAPQPASYKAIVKEIKKELNTPVKIKTTGGKNRIEISFNDEEDLQRIFDLMF